MSNTLTARVRLNVSDADRKLKNLESRINRINNTLNNSGNACNTINRQLTQVNANNKRVANSADGIAKSYKKANSAVSVLTKNLRTLVSTYLGVMGAKVVFGTSDSITAAQNKMNYVNAGDTALTQNQMLKTYAASQRSRGDYLGMLGNVAKTMTLAGDAFQDNVDNAIRFQEIMSKAYTVGGASATEQATSMYQMVQALGSGILAGDELRSVREGAPIAYKEIEKFAQGVYNTEESLKDLASQGKITSDIVVAAIMQAGDSIDQAFNETKMTYGQALTQIKNMAVLSFTPVLEMLNNALNSDAGRAIIDGIGKAFVVLANTILWVMDILGKFFSWFSDNWYWLQWVVYSVVAALIVYYSILATQAIITGIKMFIAFLTGIQPLYWIIIIIGIVIATIVYLANVTADACEFMCLALMVVAIAILAIGFIINSTVLIIAGLVIMVIALILAAFMVAGDKIMGAIYTVGAFIYNFVVGVINGILQTIWAAVDPIIGIVEWILNVVQGGFDSFGGAVANLIGQIIGWFLSLGKVVTKIIDAIFGTDWSSGLNALHDQVLNWGKKEESITISREAPTVAAISKGNLPNRLGYGDSYDAGAQVGTNWQNKLTSFASNIQNKISGLSLGGIGKAIGNFIGDKFGLNTTNAQLPNPNDPALGLGNNGGYNPSNALKGIKGDTGSIADSMELTQEDLEYLRDLANVEWKKEYTVASINVDMQNANTINGIDDVDSFYTVLTDRMYEELVSLADGVYA